MATGRLPPEGRQRVTRQGGTTIRPAGGKGKPAAKKPAAKKPAAKKPAAKKRGGMTKADRDEVAGWIEALQQTDSQAASRIDAALAQIDGLGRRVTELSAAVEGIGPALTRHVGATDERIKAAVGVNDGSFGEVERKIGQLAGQFDQRLASVEQSVGDLAYRVETLTGNIGRHTAALNDVADHVRGGDAPADLPYLPPVQAGAVPAIGRPDTDPAEGTGPGPFPRDPEPHQEPPGERDIGRDPADDGEGDDK